MAATRDASTDGYRDAMLLGDAVLLVTAVITGLLAPAMQADTGAEPGLTSRARPVRPA